MSTPNLVYVTQIRTTPAKLWEALTNPEFIEQYWFGYRNISTWQEGAAIESRNAEGELGFQGKILKSVPEKELIFSFIDIRYDEPPSRVTFRIEPHSAEAVQLTVLHDEFPEVSALRDRVSNGWPSIVEGIKTLLETGATELKAGCAAGAAK